MKIGKLSLLLSLCAVGWAASASAAEKVPAKGKLETTGALRCEIYSGVGLVLGSSRSVSCSFKRSNGTIEKYIGSISRIGLDLGAVTKSTMVWAVVPTSSNKPGSYILEGDYVGVSGGVAVGFGLGANILIGGSNKSIALQPVSVEGSQGLNVALGVGKLHLQRADLKKIKRGKKI